MKSTVAINNVVLEPNDLSDRSQPNVLVQKVYASIQKQCGTMRLLSMVRT
ncbi:hypothetical protein H6F90_21545 [Trichocoleus sp. FACHB-591]|uniref:Uncharacterized protein n=1 Tax=Trichocoleus desertorum GB2-A4 TaxID=2933944 RepID=A0ABV0JDU7_9CYAN|nr:hypothetical protein [Trichocoleus sp. FACHB-591]